MTSTEPPPAGPVAFAVFVVRRGTAQLTSLTGALLALDPAAVVNAVGRLPEVVESLADLVTTASRIAGDIEPLVARTARLADQVEAVVVRASQVSDDIGGVIGRAVDISASAEGAVALTRGLVGQLEQLVGPLRGVVDSLPPERLRGLLSRGEAALDPLPSALTQLEGEVVPAVRALAGLVPAVTSLSLDVERLHAVVGEVSSLLTGLPGASRILRRAQETRATNGPT